MSTGGTHHQPLAPRTRHIGYLLGVCVPLCLAFGIASALVDGSMRAGELPDLDDSQRKALVSLTLLGLGIGTFLTASVLCAFATAHVEQVVLRVLYGLGLSSAWIDGIHSSGVVSVTLRGVGILGVTVATALAVSFPFLVDLTFQDAARH